MSNTILCIDLNNAKLTGTLYDSMADAYKRSGVHTKTISNAIKLDEPTAKGHYWLQYDPDTHTPQNGFFKKTVKLLQEKYLPRKGKNTSMGSLTSTVENKFLTPYSHRLYKLWYNMLYRCYSANPVHSTHKEKDVSVCDRWHNLDNFVEDMDSTYFPGAVLDREDNEGDYTPDNCQWLTRGMNAQKDLSNEVHQYTLDGEYITTFVSQQEVNRFLELPIKNGSLRTAMKRKKPYKGYRWSNDYYEQLPKSEMVAWKQNIGMPVLQYSLEGEFIKEFPNCKAAVEELGVNSGGLSQVLNGKMKKTGGFTFRYKESLTEISA